jgi:hypothetical protein
LKTSLRKWSHSVVRSRLMGQCVLSTEVFQELCTELSLGLIFQPFVLDGIGGSSGKYANAEPILAVQRKRGTDGVKIAVLPKGRTELTFI